MRALLIRGTIVYGTIGAFSRAVPYFLLPYLALFLSPEEFGTLALFQASLGVATLFIAFSTPSALNRYFFELPTIEIAAWTYGSLLIIIVSTGLATLAVFLVKASLSSWLGIPVPILLAVPLVAMGQCVSSIVLDRWRHQLMFFRFAGLSIAQVSIDVSCTIFLVAVVHWGALGRVSGLGVSYLTIGVAGVFLLLAAGQLRLRADHVDYRRMLSFSFPLIPYALGAWVITSIDRYMLNSIVGPAETGIYSIGFLFGSVLILLQSFVAQAWGPVVYHALSENNASGRKEIVRLYYALASLFIVAGILLSTVVPALTMQIFGDPFAAAGEVVPWITWAFVANSMRAFLVHFIQYSKKNHLLMFASVVPALFHIVISYYLISDQGALGAAKAVFASMLLAFVLTVAVVRHSLSLPWLLEVQSS